MFKILKDSLWLANEWSKRMFIYPQKIISPGKHFDYDAYWKEKRGDKYIGNLGAWQKRRADLASKIISHRNGNSVNDIGSGAGEVLLHIKNKSHLDKAIAYDNSSYALKVAESLGLETKKFDMNNSDNYSQIEECDFSVLFEVLEHIPGPEELLKCCYDKSKKGVLFSFPNTGFFIHRFRLFFFGKFPMQWAKHPGEHLRFWTKKDLLWWLEAQGYRDYKIYYYVGIPILKSIWPNMFCAGFFVDIEK